MKIIFHVLNALIVGLILISWVTMLVYKDYTGIGVLSIIVTLCFAAIINFIVLIRREGEDVFENGKRM